MTTAHYLTIWETMGNTWVSWDAKEAYYTLFVNKEGDVVGYVKATGHGMFWELPEELIAYRKAQKAQAT